MRYKQRERQLEGIAAAKVRGVYKGRKTIKADEVKMLLADSVGATAIPAKLRISPGQRLSVGR